MQFLLKFFVYFGSTTSNFSSSSPAILFFNGITFSTMRIHLYSWPKNVSSTKRFFILSSHASLNRKKKYRCRKTYFFLVFFQLIFRRIFINERNKWMFHPHQRGWKKAAIRSRQSNEKLVTRVRKGNGQNEKDLAEDKKTHRSKQAIKCEMKKRERSSSLNLS